ncbi:MAG: hypothetical protein ABSA90_06985 [Xanthobacteraceae bacterium]|jgi:hypothetical protein
MPWITLENIDPKGATNYRETLAETEHDSDRAAGIVGAVLVDESLSALLKSRLQPDSELITELFRSSGPLGAFSVKITTGFLMGLYSKVAWKELNTIKEIRNEFAHRPARSFSFPRIYDLAINLSLSERVELHLGMTTTDRGTIWLGTKPPDDQRTIPVVEPLPADKLTARQRYMRACQFFTAAFAVLLQQPRTTPSLIF